MKSNKIKEIFIQELKKLPVVEVVCKRTGIGRASFYRWKKTDKKLAEQIEEVTQEGRLLINDMCESMIISKAKGGDLGAAKYWLGHNHPIYSDKVIQIKKPQKEEDNKKLTPEEQDLIRRVIELDYGKGWKKREEARTVRINKDLAYNVAV